MLRGTSRDHATPRAVPSAPVLAGEPALSFSGACPNAFAVALSASSRSSPAAARAAPPWGENGGFERTTASIYMVGHQGRASPPYGRLSAISMLPRPHGHHAICSKNSVLTPERPSRGRDTTWSGLSPLPQPFPRRPILAASKGGSKARWFEQALGFTRANSRGLAKQLVFDEAQAVQTGVTEFGTTFNQTIKVVGANGRTASVVTGWIKRADGIPRLVTAIPGAKP